MLGKRSSSVKENIGQDGSQNQQDIGMKSARGDHSQNMKTHKSVRFLEQQSNHHSQSKGIGEQKEVTLKDKKNIPITPATQLA